MSRTLSALVILRFSSIVTAPRAEGSIFSGSGLTGRTISRRALGNTLWPRSRIARASSAARTASRRTVAALMRR
jgi:hypothetical protein